MPNHKLVMPANIRFPDGKVIETPFEGPRFFHKDYNERSPLYLEMDTWVILRALCDIILFYRPNSIVELGAGVSTLYLAKAGYKAGVRLYTCDVNGTKYKEYYNEHIFYNMTTEEFMKQFKDTPSIVLIDADHSYEMSKREFDFFYNKLIPGGVIFLHDTFPPHEVFLDQMACGDVYKLRQEIEQQRKELDCDVFTWPYTAQFMGLTMVIKKDPDRPYFGK